MTPGLRFAVLSRDGFACVYCGATGDRSVLHVDHFVPRVRGGPDDYMNLVTACADCNIGKADSTASFPGGSLIQHIWRRSAERSLVLLRQIPFIVANYSSDDIANMAHCLPDPFWPRDGGWEEQVYYDFILRQPRRES